MFSTGVPGATVQIEVHMFINIWKVEMKPTSYKVKWVAPFSSDEFLHKTLEVGFELILLGVTAYKFLWPLTMLYHFFFSTSGALSTPPRPPCNSCLLATLRFKIVQIFAVVRVLFQQSFGTTNSRFLNIKKWIKTGPTFSGGSVILTLTIIYTVERDMVPVMAERKSALVPLGHQLQGSWVSIFAGSKEAQV